MTAADRLIVEEAAKLRRPQYRAAYLAEFDVPPPPHGWAAYICALWAEAIIALSAEDYRHGRQGW